MCCCVFFGHCGLWTNRTLTWSASRWRHWDSGAPLRSRHRLTVINTCTDWREVTLRVKLSHSLCVLYTAASGASACFHHKHHVLRVHFISDPFLFSVHVVTDFDLAVRVGPLSLRGVQCSGMFLPICWMCPFMYAFTLLAPPWSPLGKFSENVSSNMFP